MIHILLNFILMDKFFGMKIINEPDFAEIVIRFTFNLIINLAIVRWLYYTNARRKEYLFTFVLIGAVIFFLCFLLENVKLQVGIALGLFAIFGIIRYRTAVMPIKEMTYLFIVISLSVLNALANKKISYAEVIFTNLAIVTLTWILEKVWLIKQELHKEIIYEKIELVKPERISDLIEDLKNRTGLAIHRVEIGNINFMRDTALVTIFYYEENKAYQQDAMPYERGDNTDDD